MPRRQVGFAESALPDLEQALAWYSEQGVPAVGKRLMAEVFERVQVLSDRLNPHSPNHLARSAGGAEAEGFDQ